MPTVPQLPAGACAACASPGTPPPSRRPSCAPASGRWRRAARAAAHCRRSPLVGEQVYVYASAAGARRSSASCAGRCAPTQPDRTVLVRSPRAAGRCARCPGARKIPVALDPVTTSVTIEPREEVFAYLADVANHSEFMDPLFKRLAAHARGLLRRRGGRPLPLQRADGPLRLGRPELRHRRAAAAHRRRRPRRQVQPHQDLRGVGARARGAAAGPASIHVRDAIRRCRSDKLHGDHLRPPPLVQAGGDEVAQAAAAASSRRARARERATVAGL